MELSVLGNITREFRIPAGHNLASMVRLAAEIADADGAMPADASNAVIIGPSGYLRPMRSLTANQNS